MKTARFFVGFLGLFLMATSCVRTVYVGSEYPLISCPKSFEVFPMDLGTAEWKILAKESGQDCPGYTRYQVERISSSTDAPTDVRAANVYVSIRQLGGKCSLRLIVEGFCARDQSMESCKTGIARSEGQLEGPGLVRQAELMRDVFIQRLKLQGVKVSEAARSSPFSFSERAEFEKLCRK